MIPLPKPSRRGSCTPELCSTYPAAGRTKVPARGCQYLCDKHYHGMAGNMMHDKQGITAGGCRAVQQSSCNSISDMYIIQVWVPPYPSAAWFQDAHRPGGHNSALWSVRTAHWQHLQSAAANDRTAYGCSTGLVAALLHSKLQDGRADLPWFGRWPK